MNSGSFCRRRRSLPSRPRRPRKVRAAALSASAYDVIAAVNQVRASNGLAPFEINGALMAAAQAHSDYQAATGSISHTGSGGSSPGSRASAAGFSGSVIENIYGGMNASPQQAVSWWQGDSLHLNTLLSTRHTVRRRGRGHLRRRDVLHAGCRLGDRRLERVDRRLRPGCHRRFGAAPAALALRSLSTRC